MKKWREARGTPERHELLLEADRRAKGNRAEMARLLGLSREHVSRMLSGHVGHADHGVRRHHGRHAVNADGGVTPTGEGSLTYSDSRPTSRDVSQEIVQVEEETAKVSLDIPKSCIEWLDLASVRWKHRTGAPHASKSAVVTEMLRARMAEEDPTDA